MTTETILFPQGLASGEAFYNRENERNRLKHSFLNHEHTVLVAPRRYGKSSLIKQVLLDTKLPGKRIDLLPATNIQFVNKAIKLCFTEMMHQIAPKSKKAKQKLLDFIKECRPKLTIAIFGQKLEVSSTQTPENNIIDLLVGLNAAAEKVNKRIVICFDEFQQIGLLKNHNSIEAAIRHAVEGSTHITYVFSGSNRHLLSQMFSQKSRPLYHLCDLMDLDRISSSTYFPILMKKAKARWKCEVNNNVIEEILNLTKCHPYYVNALCRHLWKETKCPNSSTVQKIWLDYINTQSSWIKDDLARFTPNQRNILAVLAFEPTGELFGKEFSEKLKIAVSSIQKSVYTLLKEDFIYKNKVDGLYKVLDPAVEEYLHRIKYFDFLE